MTKDFSVTRSIIDELDGWVQRLAAPILPAQLLRVDGDVRWGFCEQTPIILMITKAVRITSGIRAALLLADEGFVTESACLLRIVSDLATEISAVAEGVLRGQMSAAQEEFVAQFFAPIPRTPEERLAQGKKRYVSREKLLKAEVRLASDAGLNGEYFRDLKRTLNSNYDAYVHGAYETAMELYHGGRHEFMLQGHESNQHRFVCRVAVAGKLHEVVVACHLIAKIQDNQPLCDDIRRSLKRLEDSGEQNGVECE